MGEKTRKVEVKTMAEKPHVAIVVASESDLLIMEQAAIMLDQFEIPYELFLTSAHRSPERTRQYIRQVQEKGIDVIIAGAGAAAHLPGVIAAETILPVIGVPIDSTSLHGMDALLSIVQMPGGVPVATMAVGKAGAKNAGILAAQILACKNRGVAERLLSYKRGLAKEIQEKAKVMDEKDFKNRSRTAGFKPSSKSGSTHPER